MSRIAIRMRRYALACCILLLLSLPAGVLSSQTRAAGLTVRTFYATTLTSFDAWCLSDASCVPPARVSAFPTRQEAVSFYFETTYKTISVLDMTALLNRFTLAIHASSGAVLVSYNLATAGGLSGARTYEGNGMARIWAPQLPTDNTGSGYPDDKYKVDLLLDGGVVATTSFTVGSGRPTVAPHPVISAFYTITKTSAHAWSPRHGPPPPRTGAFRVGAYYLFFYVSFRNASKAAPMILTVRDKMNFPMITNGPFVFPWTNGAETFYLDVPDQMAYEDGGYHATIQMGSRVLANTTFSIQG